MRHYFVPVSLYLVLFSLLTAGCGGDSASTDEPDPAKGWEWNWWSFGPTYVPDFDWISDANGIWTGNLTVMVNQCDPESFGEEQHKWLQLEVDGSEVAVVDEGGRLYTGETDQFDSFFAEWHDTGDPETAVQWSSIDFVIFGDSASVTIMETTKDGPIPCRAKHVGWVYRNVQSPAKSQQN